MRTPTSEKTWLGGVKRSYEFPNGYGASVIRLPGSYGADLGLWELAVTENGTITYDTEITDDVIGHLTDEQVDELLARIESL